MGRGGSKFSGCYTLLKTLEHYDCFNRQDRTAKTTMCKGGRI